MTNLIFMLTIAVYLIVTMAVGVYFSNQNKNTDDFYLGGRRLGPFVTAMSAEASDMSSWLLMGLPGVAYLTGLAEPFWTAVGLAIGTYFNWLIVAKRIRIYSQKIDAVTVPAFFSKRYGESKPLMFFAAVAIVVFFVPYTASGFSACGKLFSNLFGVSYTKAMIVSALVIIIYCTLGGFLAASTTDLIQSIVMSMALIIVIVFGTHMAGGMSAVMDNAKALPGYLSLDKLSNITSEDVMAGTGTTSDFGIMNILSTLAWGLGYFGVPHVLVRFMAINDKEKLKLSRRIATVWVVISLSVGVMIGIVGLGITKAGNLEYLADSETIIVNIAVLLSKYGVFATIVAGIILSGILAATMSTADSQLLAAASSVSQDIVQGCFGAKLSEKTSLTLARIMVVAISIISMFLALDANSSVFRVVSFAWAGFGASFGPVMLLALFWKKSNKNGALFGMLTGMIMVFVWKFGIANLGGVFAIYELLPAFVLALIVNIVVSKITGEPDKSIQDKFEEVSREV